MDLVADPDIEGLLIDYLTAQFPSRGVVASVSTRIPDDKPGVAKPARFVRVLKVGGDAPTVVTRRPTVTVETYAPLESQAFELAKIAGALILDLPNRAPLDGLQVYEATQAGGIANLPDPRVPDRARYTQTLTVHIRGQVL